MRFVVASLTKLLVLYSIIRHVTGAPTKLKKRSTSGWNDWSCQPSAQHPRAVVLVHGLFGNGQDNWAYMAPGIAAAGYCVFSTTYGGGPVFGGLAPIEDSAKEISAFIDKVLNATGTSKIDLVGHSEGGLLPRYYIKNLGGAAKVNLFYGIAPVGHGTTFDGLGTLAQKVGFMSALTETVCQSCMEMVIGSSFLNELDAGGDTLPGPRYVTLVTETDEAVTPYTNGQLSGPNVTNYVLQHFCPLDLSEHLGIVFDVRTLHSVLNELDPSRATTVSCQG